MPRSRQVPALLVLLGSSAIVWTGLSCSRPKTAPPKTIEEPSPLAMHAGATATTDELDPSPMTGPGSDPQLTAEPNAEDAESDGWPSAQSGAVANDQPEARPEEPTPSKRPSAVAGPGDPKAQACIIGGGRWRSYPNSGRKCHDECNKPANVMCKKKPSMGCDCGAKCWNGMRCR